MVIFVLLLSLPLHTSTLQKPHCKTSLSIRTKKICTLFLTRFSNYFRNFVSVITDDSGEQLLCGKAYRIFTSTEMVITFSSVANDQKGFLLLFEGFVCFYRPQTKLWEVLKFEPDRIVILSAAMKSNKM